MRKTLHEQREKEANRGCYGNSSSAVLRGKVKKSNCDYDSESSDTDSENEEKRDMKSEKLKIGEKSQDYERRIRSGCRDNDVRKAKKYKKNKTFEPENRVCCEVGDDCCAEVRTDTKSGCADWVSDGCDNDRGRKRKKEKKKKSLETEILGSCEPVVDCDFEVKKVKKGKKNKADCEIETVEVIVADEDLKTTGSKKFKKSKNKGKLDCVEGKEVVELQCENLATKKSKKGKRKCKTEFEGCDSVLGGVGMTEREVTDAIDKKSKKSKKKKTSKDGERKNPDLVLESSGEKSKGQKRKVGSDAAADLGVDSGVGDVRKGKKAKKLADEVDDGELTKKSKKKKSKK
jgi:hypothetical protein